MKPDSTAIRNPDLGALLKYAIHVRWEASGLLQPNNLIEAGRINFNLSISLVSISFVTSLLSA